MARNPIRTLTILASAALFPLGAQSQDRPLKDAIIGSWSVTAVVDQYDSGKQVNNWGTVKGNLTFGAGGRFNQIIIGDAQPALKTQDPRRPDAPVVAYYGTYTVDEGGKRISTQLEAASYSARAGTTFTSIVEIKGDTMTLIGSSRKDQEGTFTPRLQLRRASGM